MFTFQFVNDLKPYHAAIKALSPPECPFESIDFLLALQDCQCVDGQSGWNSHHLLIYQNQVVVAFLPLYLKQHSYGEYVFDWAWASAYDRHGLEYYPKLVSAIPFSPVASRRLQYKQGIEVAELSEAIQRHLEVYCEAHDYSSYHILFPELEESKVWTKRTMQRTSVQFHWHNKGYASTDDFYAQLKSRKRKAIRKERQHLVAAGWTFRQITSCDITADDIDFFYQCYRQTYLKLSGHTGYLSQSFFHQLQQRLSDNLLLVIGECQGQPRACALFMFSAHTLYGRYWGTLEEEEFLHFETCYYQGIEFAIQRGLSLFNPGTQGEHKVARGFKPSVCYSNHWISDLQFRQAIAAFIDTETSQLSEYQHHLANKLPYKIEDSNQ